MSDLRENMRNPKFRGFGLVGLALLAAALGVATGQWVAALALAAGLTALAANWSGVLNWLGLGGAGSLDRLGELEDVRQVAHDAAEDLARMEEILEQIVRESRRTAAEGAAAVEDLKARVSALDARGFDSAGAGQAEAHQRFGALEARLESLDEAVGVLTGSVSGAISEARGAMRAASSAATARAATPQAAPRSAEPQRLSETDHAAAFLADVAGPSRRRPASMIESAAEYAAESAAEYAVVEAAPPPRRAAPPPEVDFAADVVGGGARRSAAGASRANGSAGPITNAPASPGDLAESLRQRAQQARQGAAPQQRPAPQPVQMTATARQAAYDDEAAPEYPQAALAEAGLASLTPLSSLAALAGGGAPPAQPQTARAANGAASPNGRPNGNGAPNGRPNGAGAPQAAPGPLAPGASAPIYALAPRVIAGHELGVAPEASTSERLKLAAAKAAELLAANLEQGVHVPMRASDLMGTEIQAFLTANPDLARRLVVIVSLAEAAELRVEALDALRALGAALRLDVPSPEGLNAELFTSLKVELAAAPSLLALAMAPHAMQMGMALMATEVNDPVMLQALSIAGIPLVSGAATRLLAEAGPAPQPQQG